MLKRHVSSIAIVFGLSITLTVFTLTWLTAFPHGAAAAVATRNYENPPGGCQAWTLDIVHLTVHPNQGATWPNAIVRRNTTVQLIGTAERQQRDSFCQVTYTSLPFNWSATYQADDGSNPVDATGSLIGTSALTPTLNAVNAGWYVVRLAATGATQVATATIQVLDDGFRWVNIGPDGRPNQAVGRVNAIAFDPSQQGMLYVGTANGGVWKSLDGGRNWRPLMDNKGLPTLGIGAIAIAPSGTVYAGLGDSNTFGDNDKARPGTGIYVSTDGGVTWNPTGTGGVGCGITNLSGTYENAIRRIIIDPNNASTIYAAGDAGIFRSTNSGVCWTSIRPNLPSGEIIDDIALNPLQLLAVSRTSGVYGAQNPTAPTPMWSQVLSPPCASPLRAALAQSASSGYEYAAFGCSSVQIRLSATYGGAGSWSSIPALNETAQLGYNFALAVDPQSATRIYHGAVNVWRYQGPSGSWQNWNGPNAGTPNAQGIDAHSDFHVLTFDPFNPNELYAGTDGGVYRFDVSGLLSVASTNWTALNGNLAISQFRELGVNSNWPGDVAGGLQDNATPRRLTGRSWSGVPGNGGDGYGALYDASNRIFYGTLSPLYSILYVPANAGTGGDLVRYDPFASSQSVIASPNDAWSDPFRPGAMIVTSPGANMAGAGGQLYYGTNATTASSIMWTCIDPTPYSADIVRSVGFARVFPSGSGGLYYVGLDTGRIYLVDVQSSPPTYSNCGINGSALRSPAQSVFTPTAGTVAEINGIAEDPNRSCRIYATSVNPPDAGYRVVRVEGVIAGNSCTGPWVAQPIAGLPNTADGLPNMLNGQSFGLHRWAVAVDPLTDTVVYVGTYAGLYQGQNVSGNWHWSRALDVPDMLVVDVKAQVNAAGPFGTLYAATFGRGAYERVLVSPSASVVQTRPTRPQDLANAITRCQVRPIDDPDLRYRAADVEIEYQYNGDQGTDIRMRPNVLVDGVLSPYFIREISDVVTGTHTANMQVIYGAANEPPGLTTNGLQIEMYVDGGSSFLVSDCHFVNTWRRPDARTLEVRAEDAFAEGAAGLVSAPITVTVSNGEPQSHVAPFTLVITHGTTITLQAPTLRTGHAEPRLLHTWTLIGHADFSASPSFNFTLNDDSAAVVRYSVLEEKVYLPIVLK